MLTSAVHNYDDPNEYGSAIRGARVEMTAMGRGTFSAKLVRAWLEPQHRRRARLLIGQQ
jgi:hypothetical protein